DNGLGDTSKIFLASPHAPDQFVAFLTFGGFQICVLAAGKNGYEGFNRLFFACLTIYDMKLPTCVIDKNLFTCFMVEFSTDLQFVSPKVVVMSELGVAIATRSLLTVFMP